METQTVSDRIFELLQEKKMTQREFAEKTGIADSTISDWKRKRTNPISDKILVICQVLEVTPEYLLSGANHIGNRSRENLSCVIDYTSELGVVINTYQSLNRDMQRQVLGYMRALQEMTEKKDKKK